MLVRKNFQRRGIGRALVEAVLEPYQSVRQKVLLTDTEPAQRGFYESLGFAEAADKELRAFVRFEARERPPQR